MSLSSWLSCSWCVVGLLSSNGVAAELEWPRFRGPDGSGVCAACELPAGLGVAWSSEVPADGFSSPIAVGRRVFLTGGDEEKRVVMAFDASSGKLLWQREIPAGEEKAEVPDQCGMASSTPATDGRRVYAMFSNGDIAAVTVDGEVKWTKHLGAPKNMYGHATSLITSQSNVIVQLDQGDADDDLSRLIAFDGATGKVVWEQKRKVGSSWATPLALNDQIITLANPFVISYAAKDGSERWRAECLDGEVTPSPVFVDGTLMVVSPSSKLQTMRVDGSGDVTKTHLGWVAEDGIPDITSPVCSQGLVFLIDSTGTLTCYDAKDGRKQWTHDLEEECNASPSIAGRHLIIATKKGTLIVLDVAREFKELSRIAMDEQVLASPAFASDRMFVRGAKHLFCLGAKP